MTEEPLDQRLRKARMHLHGIDALTTSLLDPEDREALAGALDESLSLEEQAENVARVIGHLLSSHGAYWERQFQEMKAKGIAVD